MTGEADPRTLRAVTQDLIDLTTRLRKLVAIRDGLPPGSPDRRAAEDRIEALMRRIWCVKDEPVERREA